jgi:hypothetical protein
MELDASSLLANVQLNETNNNNNNHPHSKNCVLWQRLEPSTCNFTSVSTTHTTATTTSNSNKKRRRIVDAVLLENKHTETTTTKNTASFAAQTNNSNKRRKLLTLQLLEPSSSSSSAATCRNPVNERIIHPHKQSQSQLQTQTSLKKFTKKKVAYPILSPEKRIVDDSLHQLLQGNISVAEHCALLHQQTQVVVATTTTKTARKMNTTTTTIFHNDNSDWFWPWTFCDSNQHNNWLHACALWNQGTIAKEELQRLRHHHHQQQQQASPTEKEQEELTWTALLHCMLTATNSDGYTPMQLAHHLRHDTTTQILESYASQIRSDSRRTPIWMMDNDLEKKKKKHASNQGNSHGPDDALEKNDWMNYDEYDLYRIVEPGTVLSTSTECRGDDDNNDDDDPRILDCELHDRCTGYFDEYGELVLEPEKRMAHHHSLHAFTDADRVCNDDDDWDSNDEDCFANDYPDEEQDDDDDDDWSSQRSGGNSSNDSREVHLDTTYRQRPFVVSREDDEYDAAYGICDQRDIEYDDECE